MALILINTDFCYHCKIIMEKEEDLINLAKTSDVKLIVINCKSFDDSILRRLV